MSSITTRLRSVCLCQHRRVYSTWAQLRVDFFFGRHCKEGYGSESTGLTLRARWRNPTLHERCTTNDMLNLQEAFRQAPKQKFSRNDFRTALRDILNVEYDDEEYNILFLKIDTSRTGQIGWDELVSHLMLGYFSSDPEGQNENLQLPIVGLPVVMRSRHRHPISKICFCPEVNKAREIEEGQGIYLTISREGAVNWWSLDMALLRTTNSTSPYLKIHTTWITDMVCLPDVNIVATSSTERDLRFYDCTAGNFTLKIVLYSWEYMICTMHYHFHRDINEKSMLVCGDAGGNIRVLLFSPVLRGPFQNRPGRALIELRHVDWQKKPKLLPEMQLVEIRGAHTDWIRQVSYYGSLHSVVSCATAPDALLMTDLTGSKTRYLFRVDKGIQCFAFDESVHCLVTGGPDCTVRVWNPFVPAKPSVVLLGHRAGIVAIILQNDASRIYSLSRDRVIKVWDVQAQTCVQTYIDIPSSVGERAPLSCAYNPCSRELVVGAIKIAVLLLDEQLNTKHTDGSTHSRAISSVLYNPLFKIIVTCGLDSIIMNWDPHTGKRNMIVLNAHTCPFHGELVPVEITAACFDPGYLLLLTGARDGSLQVWNFNTGVRLRRMSIERMCEVTNVFWVEGRILAVGWNRHITEFEDTGTATTGKAWETRHTDDVLAAAFRPPLSLVTSSYNSELVMWKLETGQAYRRYSCMKPTERIKMNYGKRETQRAAAAPERAGAGGEDEGDATQRRKQIITKPAVDGAARVNVIEPSKAMMKARARKENPITEQAQSGGMRDVAVHSMAFLRTRPFEPQVGSLMIGLENGKVQCWSDHPAGGYKGSFHAVHSPGDYVTYMVTDDMDQFLFCGTAIGYIKVWLMSNYFRGEEVHVNMPALRLEFPFTWRDRVEGRAKRAVRGQPLPVLLNSYRAHTRRVTSLAYVQEKKLLFSGSSDYSVRVWRLSGEYVQTLGGLWTGEPGELHFPPDVNKIISSTTLKVFRHGDVSRFTPGLPDPNAGDELRGVTEEELMTMTTGVRAEEPLLGSHFQLPRRPDRQEQIVLDESLPTIPLYRELRLASTHAVRRPPTPDLVRTTRMKRERKKTAHFAPNV